MTDANARVDLVLKWLPWSMGGAACALAMSLYRELPHLAAVMMLATLSTVAWWISGLLMRAAERFLVTPAGFKWDWVLFPIFLVAAFRYGAPLVTGRDFFLPRFLMWMLGLLFVALGGRMAREMRLRFALEADPWLRLAIETPPPKAEDGWLLGELDWHRDVARYQVPLVLFALGLTLFQMS